MTYGAMQNAGNWRQRFGEGILTADTKCNPSRMPYNGAVGEGDSGAWRRAGEAFHGEEEGIMARRTPSGTERRRLMKAKRFEEFSRILGSDFTTMDAFFEGVLEPIWGRASFVPAHVDALGRGVEAARCEGEGYVKAIVESGTFGAGNIDLKVFEIVVDDRATMRSVRAVVRRVVRALMEACDRALIVMRYENPVGRSWRLSYASGRGVAGKRFTYLFGSGHGVRTAAERLSALASAENIGVEAIAEAFSVHAVAREFYTKLHHWYTWAQDETLNVGFATNSKESGRGRAHLNEYLLRLITRLIFAWFIKQKGLVSEDLFDVRKLGRYLRAFDPLAGKGGEGCRPQREETACYYRGILQNLFFKVLDGKDGERKSAREGADPDGGKSGYGVETPCRYADLLTDFGRVEVSRRFEQTPFLNVGLFDCRDNSDGAEADVAGDEGKGVVEGDGGNRRSRRRGDGFVPNILFFNEDEKQPGIITLLKQYSFTVEESAPDDAVVALDPELLGKVFENLLAQYTAPSRKTVRSATGSYYTPREIVRYMAETSICEHMKTRIEENRGAGIAPETIEKLVYGDTCPEELQGKEAFVREILFQTKILDPACGAGAFPMGVMQRMIEISNKLRPEGRDDVYEAKRRIIENCLYGVDILPLAVQITKLRCYISLIAEEEIDPDKPNAGIRPLPNLEERFVAANSLVPLEIAAGRNPAQGGLSREDVRRERDEWLRVRRAISSTPNDAERRCLREKESASRRRLAELLQKNTPLSDDDVERVLQWDPGDPDRSCGFFDPEWMFGVGDGFDIVIGNPPYGAKMSANDKAVYKRTYRWLFKRYDIYMVFFELAFRLSKSIICYVTPDKWLSKSFGIVFRREAMIPCMTQILHLGNGVFDGASVDAIISTCHKKGSKRLKLLRAESASDYKVVNAIDKSKIVEPFLIDEYFRETPAAIVGRIERNAHRLGEYAKCEYASVSPSEAYRLKAIVSCNPTPGEDELKVINTGLVGKYATRWGQKRMIYLKATFEHPVVAIDAVREMFGETYARKMASPKLILKGLNRLDCAVDFEGRMMSTVATLNIRSESPVMLSVLSAIINSSAAEEYCRAKYISSSYCSGLLFTPDMINRLPVPDLSDLSSWKEIVEIVNRIVREGGGEEDEKSLDEMVRERLSV